MSEKKDQPETPGLDEQPTAEGENDATAAKAVAVTVEVDGHEYTVLPGARDDFEILDDLSELERTGNAVLVASLLRRVLGPAQIRLALDRLRDEETGRVSVDAGHTFVMALLSGLNPN